MFERDFARSRVAVPMNGDTAGRTPDSRFPLANVWHPGTESEAAMDEMDAANWLIFGNKAFRLDQRNIIKAALQVISFSHSLFSLHSGPNLQTAQFCGCQGRCF